MKGKQRTLAFAIGSALVLGCLLLVTLLNSAAITRQLHSWKLLPEPERLTELYFTDHKTLPTTYTPGETQNVAFTIHNLEHRTTAYTYTVVQTVEDGSSPAELARGSVNLAHNQTSQQTTAVILTDLGPKSRVNIMLNTGEKIFYIVTRRG